MKAQLFLCTLLLLTLRDTADADGVGEFVIKLVSEFPDWLSRNYPNSSYPYPSTDPIKVELRSTNVSEIDVLFYDYQVQNHTKKENWRIYENLADLSIGVIAVDFNLWRTTFGGTYVANGTYKQNPVTGQGSWEVQGNQFIGVKMEYVGVVVTPEDYVDLNAGNNVTGGYEYIYGYSKEMQGLSAGGYEDEVQKLALDALHNQMSDKLEHPLVAPLNKFFQDAFASTPIPEM